MQLSEEVVEFFDEKLEEVVKKFRPANGETLEPEEAEETFRVVIRQYAQKGFGRIDKSFIDERVQQHIYGNEDRPDDERLASIIMFALDYYCRPMLMNKGYSEREAHDLWNAYMAEGGDYKLFEEISDFDGS